MIVKEQGHPVQKIYFREGAKKLQQPKIIGFREATELQYTRCHAKELKRK